MACCVAILHTFVRSFVPSLSVRLPFPFPACYLHPAQCPPTARPKFGPASQPATKATDTLLYSAPSLLWPPARLRLRLALTDATHAQCGPMGRSVGRSAGWLAQLAIAQDSNSLTSNGRPADRPSAWRRSGGACQNRAIYCH